MKAESASPKKPKSGWLNLAIDFGPILIFFLVHRYFAPENSDRNPVQAVLAVMYGTASFMVSAVVALVLSKLKFGRVSPMLWLSTALIVGFGAITIYTQNPDWIRHKPTAIYLLFSAILFLGLWRGKPLLKYLLEAAFEGLNDTGWTKLSRNWAFFFLVLAALNEALCIKVGGKYYIDIDAWIWAKLWLFMPLTFLFTFLHIPMLLRHGMAEESAGEALADEPPPQ
jgi:intracellular septation protein